MFYIVCGEKKPNWPWNLIEHPSQLLTFIGIPTALLWKEKKRIMSKSKLDILQANSKLFYAYICSSHFIFCAVEGRPKHSQIPVIAFSHLECPRPSGRLYELISWAADGWLSVSSFPTSWWGCWWTWQRRGEPLAVWGAGGAMRTTPPRPGVL